MRPRELTALRNELESALSRQRHREALELLADLQEKEPNEPRWPHRRGDILRKLGEKRPAVEAYEAAANLYAEQGFLARAVAMAKTILLIDSSRTDVLMRVDPTEARELSRRHRRTTPPPAGSIPPQPISRSAGVSAPPPAMVANPAIPPPPSSPAPPSMPPAQTAPARPPLVQPSRGESAPMFAGLSSAVRTGGSTDLPEPPSEPDTKQRTSMFVAPDVPSAILAAPELERAVDANVDEIRFDDVEGEDEIEIDFSEMEVAARNPNDGVIEVAEPSAERLAMLPVFPIFAEAPKEVLLDIAIGSDLIELEDGQYLVRTGEPSDALYLIVEGAVRVIVPQASEDHVVFLTEGDVIGESSLLEGEQRRADVIAHGRLVALRIGAALLTQAMKAFPPLGDLLFEMLTRRLIGNLMQTSRLFTAFDTSTRLELARMFEVRRAARDTILLEAGKRSDGLYIPLTGRVRIEAPDGRPSRVLGPGTVLGQKSLLTNAPSDKTVRAAMDMAVLRLPAQRFIRVAMQYPPVLEQLTDLVSRSDALGQENML